MIPNNQSSVSTSGARAQIPPDTYKNNILKAKTYDENKIAPTASVSSGVSSANERMQGWVAHLESIEACFTFCKILLQHESELDWRLASTKRSAGYV